MKLSQAEQIKMVLETMLDTRGIVGYKIARNLRMINEELVEYLKFKRELFEKYGRAENNQLIIDKENEPMFLAELKPFAEQEVEFNFRTITEEELEQSNLNASQMMFLMEYFEERNNDNTDL